MRHILSFLLAAFLIAACGGKSDKELLQEAQNLGDQKKYDEALLSYEKLVEEHPQSVLAGTALFQAAKIYHAKLLKNITATESLKKAKDYYKKIYDNYPSSAEAPNALFMAAFIEANELNELEEARNTYQLFLEKYPKSELSESARAELENLGKAPEEILKDKILQGTGAN